MGFTLNTSFNEKYHYFNEISKLDHLNWFPYVRYKIIITFSFKWRSSVPSFTSSITYHNRGCERQHYALYLLMIQTLSYTRLAPVENINAHLCRTARVTPQPDDKLKSRELNSEDCMQHDCSSSTHYELKLRNPPRANSSELGENIEIGSWNCSAN